MNIDFDFKSIDALVPNKRVSLSSLKSRHWLFFFSYESPSGTFFQKKDILSMLKIQFNVENKAV